VRWSLASINGELLPEAVEANVLFTPADSPAAQGEENMVNGSAGCNNFFGSYSTAGDTLTAGPFGLTQMMCEDAAMQVEQAFLSGLETAVNYEITLNQLIIYTESGSLLFYADRMPLEGPQWILTGMGAIDNPQPPIEVAMFTANFSRQFGMPSGVKSGGTGCQDYTATYYAFGDEIKVNLPQTSQNDCSDGQMEAEQGYFLGLNAARDFRILGNELYIYYDNYVLIFVGSYPEAGPETGPLTVLDGTQWWLTSIDTFLAVPGSEVTIAFSINPDGRTGNVSGSGGCNTYNAEITDVFTLGPINATAALCDIPDGVMEQEASYLNVLQNAVGVWIEGDTLRITTNLETLYFTNSGPAPVQPLPVMAAIEAPEEGTAGELITFDGSGSTSDVEITAYQWDFGDGTEVAEGAVIEHAFEAAGVYEVTLTITDANGQTATASVEISIE
jgi:heat shock protein HslJ